MLQTEIFQIVSKSHDRIIHINLIHFHLHTISCEVTFICIRSVALTMILHMCSSYANQATLAATELSKRQPIHTMVLDPH